MKFVLILIMLFSALSAENTKKRTWAETWEWMNRFTVSHEKNFCFRDENKDLKICKEVGELKSPTLNEIKKISSKLDKFVYVGEKKDEDWVFVKNIKNEWKGDCDDWAIRLKEMLLRKGYVGVLEIGLLAMPQGVTPHVFVVVKDIDGKFWLFDNNSPDGAEIVVLKRLDNGGEIALKIVRYIGMRPVYIDYFVYREVKFKKKEVKKNTK